MRVHHPHPQPLRHLLAGFRAYTHETKWIVLTALSRSQAVALRVYLKSADPDAFILVTNSSEIFGKGFMRV